jgi:SAM-dependent methyltransferase
MNIFDSSAQVFALGVDEQIAAGRYLRGELFVRAIKTVLKDKGIVLDYGCGPGRLSKMVAQLGHQVIGVDTSTGMIAEAKQQDLRGLNVSFQTVTGPLNALPFANVDVVVASSVIEYVPDPAQTLSEWVTLLKPGGVILMSFANRRSMWRRLARRLRPTAPHLVLQLNIWSEDECRDRLLQAGAQQFGPVSYFEAAPFDQRNWLAGLSRSPWIGALGLMLARKQ